MSQSSTAAKESAGVAAVLAKFDRSSPEKLLNSLATEILRLQREQADLAARLMAVEQLQSITDRLLPGPGSRTPSADLPKSLVIDATHAMLDSAGFYPLEFDAAGTAHRWTGPSAQFSLNFFIDRQHGGRFRLSFSRFAANVSASFMRCLLDGRPAEFNVHDLRNGFEISGTMPQRHDGGASVLTFICPATASPAQIGQSTDTRQLGLCFQKLVVRAAPAPAMEMTETVSEPTSEPVAEPVRPARRGKRAE